MIAGAGIEIVEISRFKKAKKKWGKNFQTNPKFSTFDQKFYTAGDQSDFDKYGILSSMFYIAKEEQDAHKNKKKDGKNNINDKI